MIQQNKDDCSRYILQCKPLQCYTQLKQVIEWRHVACQKLIDIIVTTLDTIQLTEQQLKANKQGPNVIQFEDQLYYYPIDVRNYMQYFETKLAAQQQSEQQIKREYFDQLILFGSAFQINKDLCTKILLNQITPEQLICFSRLDLMNDDQLSQRAQYEEKLQEKRDLERYIQNTGIECKFCHQKTVIVTEKQTRSADEATTVIYTCSSCHRSWRFNN